MEVDEESQLHVLLVTEDEANKKIAREENIPAYGVKEYIKQFSGQPDLVDNVSADVQGLKISKDDFQEYPAHKPLTEIQHGIKHRTLFQGKYTTSR